MSDLDDRVNELKRLIDPHESWLRIGDSAASLNAEIRLLRDAANNALGIIEELQQHNDVLADMLSDICLHHSPQQIDALRAELARTTEYIACQEDNHQVMIAAISEKDAAVFEAKDAKAELAELEAVLKESNEVCACGCPADDHESYGEDGESCGIDDHECVRTSVAVRDILAAAMAECRELKTALAHSTTANWVDRSESTGLAANESNERT